MINRRPTVTSMRMSADDIWPVVLVLPVLSLAFGVVVFGTTIFQSPENFVKGYFPTFFLVILFHLAFVKISYATRRRYPTHPETARRLLSALALYFLTTFAAIHASLWLYEQIGLLGFKKTPDLTRRCLAVGFVGNIINSIMYDVFYTFAKMKEALVTKESLQKEHLRQQFDALKTQVNPHFLFNNLNTLSELIEIDADAADRFLNEMSKVYRYMLRSRNYTWVSVQQELHCLHSYFYLHTVRFGQMLVFQNEIASHHKAWQLPSLTLSLIVEEAIRTNRFSKAEPLVIRVRSEGDKLVLTCQHKPKPRLMETQGLNWTLLTDKFDEQELAGFSRTVKKGMLTVALPLLHPHETFAAA